MFLEEKKQGEVTLEPWRQLLHRTADYIEHHGWCQRRTVNDKGEVCIIGALNCVITDKHTYYTAEAYLRQKVGSRVVRWNDQPGRTKEEVLALLRS